MSVLDKMPPMPQLGRLPRPPRLRNKPATAPRGPRIYHRGEPPIPGSNIFMTPPPDFVTAHTSLTEWMCFYALYLLTGLPKDPFHRPYIGGLPLWTYQKEEAGGRVPGGSVS